MRLQKAEPTYLQLCWDQTQPDGSIVPLEAFLCLPHRREKFAEHPGALGRGRLGPDCDLCAGREPRRVPAPRRHRWKHDQALLLGHYGAGSTCPAKGNVASVGEGQMLVDRADGG
jgi:hypothetical protein